MTLLPFPTLQAMLAIVLVSELLLMRSHLSGDASRSADRGSLPLLMRVIGASVAAAWIAGRLVPQARFETLLGLAPAAVWTIYGVGIALWAAGLALRWYAIGYLGRMFTFDVAIVADHRVVDTGPYRFVRHPAYTGSLLTFTGIGLCGGNLLALVVLVTPIVLAFLRRMAIEEATLSRALGRAYEDYAARTKRLIPALY